jgi:hypothetical protein
MARRYRSSSRGFPIDAVFAGAAAYVTVWHRLPLIALSSLYEEAERRTEIGRMFDEKFAAMIDGAIRANLEAMRLGSLAATGRLNSQDLANAPVSIMAAGIRPSFRRVRGNARRLNRRALRRLSS